MARRRLRNPVGNASVVRDSVGAQFLAAIDQTVEARWAAAQSRAHEFEGTTDQRVEALTARFRRELGAVGATSGGASAIPGVGLGTAAATFTAELAWSTMRLGDLILTIAAIHGHDRAEVEERRLWVLSILTYRDGAAGMVAKMAADLAESPGKRGARQLTRRTIRQINSSIGAGVIAKYGSRRVIAAMGRAIPFGVGAILGYGMNSRAVTMTAKHAHDFFVAFPITIDAIDTDGYVVPTQIEATGVTPPLPDPATRRAGSR